MLPNQVAIVTAGDVPDVLTGDFIIIIESDDTTNLPVGNYEVLVAASGNSFTITVPGLAEASPLSGLVTWDRAANQEA